jgi:hypothetical protein
MTRIAIDWLRLTRVATQYVVPGVLACALLVEISGTQTSLAYDYIVAIVSSLLTLVMIGACGWIVFLSDIDRLVFSLERKIDTEAVTDAGDEGWILGRVRDALASKVARLRAKAVRSIENAYWEDINAGGVLAFPQPNIARAIEHIDEGRRDLLRPLTELVARTVPSALRLRRSSRGCSFAISRPRSSCASIAGTFCASSPSSRRLFILAALCFYFSIL